MWDVYAKKREATWVKTRSKQTIPRPAFSTQHKLNSTDILDEKSQYTHLYCFQNFRIINYHFSAHDKSLATLNTCGPFESLYPMKSAARDRIMKYRWLHKGTC